MSGHDFRVLTKKSRFHGAIFTVVSDEVLMPDGTTATRDVVHHLGVVAVLAFDPPGRIALVRQYRHPVGQRMWELPAGLVDPDEAFEVAARRELAEETDLLAGQLEHLLDMHTSPGYSDEFVRVYLARDVFPAAEPAAHARREEEADMTWEWVPLDRAVQMVLEGEITNAICQVAVLATALRLWR